MVRVFRMIKVLSGVNNGWKKDWKKRRGFFFSTDALLALGLIIVVLGFASMLYVKKPVFVMSDYKAEDLISVLSELKINEINNSYKDYLVSNGIIKDYDLNKSILEVIGKLFVSGHETEAGLLFANITKPLFDERFNYGLYLDDNPVFVSDNNTSPRNSISFSRLISGIQEEKPVEGYTARAFITSLTGKVFSNYVFFGGLEGQGNLSVRIGLPNYNEIIRVYFEFDTDSNFSLFINNNFAGSYPNSGCSGGGFMRPYKCEVNQTYYSLFHQGDNRVRIVFYNDLNHSFVGGGFLRIDFETDDLNYSSIDYDQDKNLVSSKQNFIGVEGVINKYGSFFVPGYLNSMSLFLNFTTDYPIFVNIGNVTVYDGAINNDTGNMSVYIDNSTLSSLLDYNDLSLKTVPIKIGHAEVENVSVVGHEADVVLITDLSGSMNWRFDSDSNGIVRDCDDPNLFNDNTKRISVAKCLDKEFIDIIMNESSPGNRLWLVDFNSQANSFYSDDKDELKAHVDSYPDSPSGGTCICCAVNKAFEILSTYSNSSRKKFVVVMTDGLPTYCCDKKISYCYWWWCVYECETTGNYTYYQYYSSSCSGGSSDCTGDDCEGPINSSIYSSYRVHHYLNASVYTIGFGPVVNCENANYTLTQMAFIGNGSYYGSQDPNRLSDIYKEIGHTINNKSAIYEYQKILVNNVTSTLYDNSFIWINYTPLNPPVVYGRIPIRLETEEFGNNETTGSFTVPENTTVIDAYVTSFSSYYWSSYLSVNSEEVFNLSKYGSEFPFLGDPFLINIPVDKINEGVNNVLLKTSPNVSIYTGGSPDDKTVYTILIRNFVSYSAVDSRASGCNWTVNFEDGTNTSLLIPNSYSGTEHCVYNASASGTNCLFNGSSTTNDAVNQAVCELLSQLDPDSNGELDVIISQDSIDLEIVVVGKVPSLWGPAVMKLVVWQ